MPLRMSFLLLKSATFSRWFLRLSHHKENGECFRVLFVFSWKQIDINSEKCIEHGK